MDRNSDKKTADQSLFPLSRFPNQSSTRARQSKFTPAQLPNQTTSAEEVIAKVRHKEPSADPRQPKRGRASLINPVNRYEMIASEKEDDGWGSLAAEPNEVTTQYIKDSTRRIINYISSPDLPLKRTINPYRGCEHGCIYCYARPTHAYLGFSPGLDFETKIIYKPDAARLLRAELQAANYRCAPIMLGANTDPYQQAERKFKLTRSILEVMNELHHPVTIITKSALISRDMDILTSLARKQLVQVFITITSLRPELINKMEPRASAPLRRLELVKQLTAARVPVGVMVAPIIPFINDAEMETIMEEAATEGAGAISYVFLRLPYELKEIFATWLEHHYPLKAKRVLARIIDSRDGRLYDSSYHKRMKGSGLYAELIRARFERQRKKLALAGLKPLRADLFRQAASQQREMF